MVYSPTTNTDKTVLVVGVAQGRDHLALQELMAAVAFCAKVVLIVFVAVIFTLFDEEAPLGEATGTY